MSYDSSDAAWDEAYERMSAELYPEHREQAIAEFARERLQSYYLRHPDLTVPGFRMQAQARSLLDDKYFSPCLVFAASAAEQFLRVALLKPVVYGLVHVEPLAEIVVDAALSQTGYVRYSKLLSGLFLSLTSTDLGTFRRSAGRKPLLIEASELQDKRNAVVHRAAEVSMEEATAALAVSAGVYLHFLVSMLSTLGLKQENGRVLVA